MVVVGLTGPPGSGKMTVARILKEQFNFKFLTFEPPPNHNGSAKDDDTEGLGGSLSEQRVLEEVTRDWKRNCVIASFWSLDQLLPFRKRPFFLLLSVDASFLLRSKRYLSRQGGGGDDGIDRLKVFMELDHSILYSVGGVRACIGLRDCEILNAGSVKDLTNDIEKLSFSNPERIRPNWDTYFVRLSFLAASRANCMRRRVGAVIVRECRLVATGYNGTPFGVLNCSEGGCERCNKGDARQGESLDKCLCMHAECNAVLEAGRERCIGGTLYVTCSPCLGCAKLIVQTGITRVVYAAEYDLASGSLQFLRAANVEVSRYQDSHPPSIAVEMCPVPAPHTASTF